MDPLTMFCALGYRNRFHMEESDSFILWRNRVTFYGANKTVNKR